jgi:hypothetical protein
MIEVKRCFISGIDLYFTKIEKNNLTIRLAKPAWLEFGLYFSLQAGRIYRAQN